MDVSPPTQKILDRNSATGDPGQDRILCLDDLWRMNAYWRAANYLSVGQIHLYHNPLLREPLTLSWLPASLRFRNG